MSRRPPSPACGAPVRRVTERGDIYAIGEHVQALLGTKDSLAISFLVDDENAHLGADASTPARREQTNHEARGGESVFGRSGMGRKSGRAIAAFSARSR
jgi:hypothetical protein